MRMPRRRPRAGVSLISLLATLPVLMVMLGVLSRLTPVLLRDAPRVQEAVQVHGVLSGVLRHLQWDVDAAASLPDAHAGRAAGEKLLLLELPGRTVCYRVAGDLIVKEEEAAGQFQQVRSWSVPRSAVSFHQWPASGAVEVRTAVEYGGRGKPENRLANAHVFYVGALPGRREKP